MVKLDTHVDQCMCGATCDGQAVRKSTEVASDQELPEIQAMCDDTHVHLPGGLQGRNSIGARTAQAAVFADRLCHSILASADRIHTFQTGGRIRIYTTGIDEGGSSSTEHVVGILRSELFTVTKQ